MAGMELASVIRQLRAELNEALADAEGERLRFELGPVEMSLTVTVGREAAPGAKDPLLGRRSRRGCQVVARVGPGHQAGAEPCGYAGSGRPGGQAAAPLIRGRAVEGER